MTNGRPGCLSWNFAVVFETVDFPLGSAVMLKSRIERYRSSCRSIASAGDLVADLCLVAMHFYADLRTFGLTSAIPFSFFAAAAGLDATARPGAFFGGAASSRCTLLRRASIRLMTLAEVGAGSS